MPVRLVEKQLISGPNQSDRGFGSNCTIYYCVQFGFRDPERRVPQGHPIRRIKQLADAALEKLSPLFDQMCSTIGRLLKASLLMALYTVSSERMLCERLNYDVGLNQLAENLSLSHQRPRRCRLGRRPKRRSKSSALNRP
jgi:hypothetical protein